MPERERRRGTHRATERALDLSRVEIRAELPRLLRVRLADRSGHREQRARRVEHDDAPVHSARFPASAGSLAEALRLEAQRTVDQRVERLERYRHHELERLLQGERAADRVEQLVIDGVQDHLLGEREGQLDAVVEERRIPMEIKLAKLVVPHTLLEQATLQQIDRVLASVEPRDLELDHLLEHRIDVGGGVDGVGNRLDQLRVLGLVCEDAQVLGDPTHSVGHRREHLEDARILDFVRVHARQSRHRQLLPSPDGTPVYPSRERSL